MTARRRHVRPESRPCPLLTHWGVAVIRASYKLPLAGKLVIELFRELDRGDGAFLAPAEAAAQLGMHQSYFEEVRAALVRLGLVLQVSVEESRLHFWFPCLPPDFPVEPPPGSSQEDRRRWLRTWADELDRRLEPGRAGPRWYRSQPGKAGPIEPGEPGKAGHYNPAEPASPSPLNPAVPASQPGRAGPIEHARAAAERPSVTLKAVTTQGVSHSPNPPESDSESARSKASETEQHGTAPRDPATLRRAYRELARADAGKK